MYTMIFNTLVSLSEKKPIAVSHNIANTSLLSSNGLLHYQASKIFHAR